MTSHAQLLRASSQPKGETYDLKAVLGVGEDDGGIPHGKALVDFAAAVLGSDNQLLARARTRLTDALDTDGLVDAAAIVANFNAIDRIADATGIPIDTERVELTADLRAELGIDAFCRGSNLIILPSSQPRLDCRGGHGTEP